MKYISLAENLPKQLTLLTKKLKVIQILFWRMLTHNFYNSSVPTDHFINFMNCLAKSSLWQLLTMAHFPWRPWRTSCCLWLGMLWCCPFIIPEPQALSLHLLSGRLEMTMDWSMHILQLSLWSRDSSNQHRLVYVEEKKSATFFALPETVFL